MSHCYAVTITTKINQLFRMTMNKAGNLIELRDNVVNPGLTFSLGNIVLVGCELVNVGKNRVVGVSRFGLFVFAMKLRNVADILSEIVGHSK